MTEDKSNEKADQPAESEDPFEEMEQELSDHHGDPFSELAETYNGDGDSGDSSSTADFTAGDPFIESTGNNPPDKEPSTLWDNMQSGSGGDESNISVEDSPQQPTSQSQQQPSTADTDLFMDSVSRSGDPFEPGQGVFESVDVETVDPDSVWQELTGAESTGSRGRVRTYADVSKHSFCEQCEHFSEPPEIACGHEGTEIVEFLDMERIRLIDCPIVAERKALESETSSGTYQPE